MLASVVALQPHALGLSLAMHSGKTIGFASRSSHIKLHREHTLVTQRATQSETCLCETLPKVVLKGGKNKLFQGDHKSVIVYPGAIDCVIGRPPPKSGDAVLLCNGKREVMALGVINPESLYAVRILETFDKDALPDYLLSSGYDAEDLLNGLIQERIDSAVALRNALSLPCQHDSGMGRTTVYRLINSEGDCISGLIVDVFDTVVVVSSSAIWIENRKSIITESILKSVPHVHKIVWRPSREMLEMEGISNEKIDVPTDGDPGTTEAIIVEECGAQFHVAPHGQKTGFYVDQRDHRSFISQISRGKDVVDICCYTGGFSIQAARGGASSVTGVDSSQSAIDLARRNATLNACACNFIKQDASRFMDESIEQEKQWDIVVLDPPKLAPTRKSLASARRKYESLNAKAMRLVKSGGLLMTCSCSGAMTQSYGEFTKVIQSAAHRAGVSATILHKRGAGGDHPINPNYPEGEYLSNYLVRILY